MENKTRLVETTLRVRYAETDAMGVVYHANYLIWFEVGRGEYFRSLNQDYNAWEKQGLFFPVVELHACYRAPARYGDLVRIRTWVEAIRSRDITFGYQVQMANTGQTLVTGWTRHVCADASGHACPIPEPLRTSLLS